MSDFSYVLAVGTEFESRWFLFFNYLIGSLPSIRSLDFSWTPDNYLNGDGLHIGSLEFWWTPDNYLIGDGLHISSLDFWWTSIGLSTPYGVQFKYYWSS